MDFLGIDSFADSSSCEKMIAEGVQRCPFLKNIGKSTGFCFSSPLRFPTHAKSTQGPIFEDGPDFEIAFRLFHGHNGVVPLSGRMDQIAKEPEFSTDKAESSNIKFHPLAASAAAISLSALGPSGPFGFDAFKANRIGEVKGNRHPEKQEHGSEKKQSLDLYGHESLSNEWLRTGNCPIAKSFRAVSGVLPLVAKMLQPPPGMKLRCPPAVVAARAALARTAAVKTLRPQPLQTKVLAVGLLGMALNIPLGIWREHTEKFSLNWFVAVHASVPFVAMLRKAVHMPKYAMSFTIAASILGQVIGSRAERRRLELAQVSEINSCMQRLPEVTGTFDLPGVVMKEGPLKVSSFEDASHPFNPHCGKETWASFKDTKSPPDPIGAF